MIQDNSTPEHGVDPLFYDVGTILRFVAYNDQEMPGWNEELEEESLGQHGYLFKPGDLLRVAYKNGCGMGIDVVRIGDGHPDMVWPEEVVLVVT